MKSKTVTTAHVAAMRLLLGSVLERVGEEADKAFNVIEVTGRVASEAVRDGNDDGDVSWPSIRAQLKLATASLAVLDTVLAGARDVLGKDDPEAELVQQLVQHARDSRDALLVAVNDREAEDMFDADRTLHEHAQVIHAQERARLDRDELPWLKVSHNDQVTVAKAVQALPRHGLAMPLVGWLCGEPADFQRTHGNGAYFLWFKWKGNAYTVRVAEQVYDATPRVDVIE